MSFVPTCMFHHMNPSFALYPVNVVTINHLAYADDIVILSSSYSEMQNLLEAVNRHAAAVGMRINASKTKVMSALIPGE